eukprot:5952613-Prymnesium_polylepis.1
MRRPALGAVHRWLVWGYLPSLACVCRLSKPACQNLAASSTRLLAACDTFACRLLDQSVRIGLRSAFKTEQLSFLAWVCMDQLPPWHVSILASSWRSRPSPVLVQ